MNILCRLLDPKRSGATRGKWELSKYVEDYAYSLVQHADCANGYACLCFQFLLHKMGEYIHSKIL